jgi:hypothetical protein
MNVTQDDSNIFLNNPTTEVLKELITSESLHKMFWPHLCKREDFRLRRTTEEGIDELFVEHLILDTDFSSNGKSEEASNLGGVIDLYASDGGTGVTSKSDFYFGQRGSAIMEPSWYELEEYLNFYEYENAFTGGGEESLVGIAKTSAFMSPHGFLDLTDYTFLAAFLTLALTFSSDVDKFEKLPENLIPTNEFSKK